MTFVLFSSDVSAINKGCQKILLIEISEQCLHTRYSAEYYILKWKLRLLLLKIRLFFSHYKSSRAEVFFKNAVLKNFGKFTENIPETGVSFFTPQSSKLIKKRLQHRCLSGYCDFKNASEWLLLSDFSANTEPDCSLKSYYTKWDNSET